MSESPPIVVAAGIVTEGGRILIGQRLRSDAYGLRWEFPGGKVQEGETLEAALRRELAEELGIDAEVGKEAFRGRYRYPDRDVEIVFFSVASYRGVVRNYAFESIAWARRAELRDYNFLEADRELVERLARGEAVGG